jgi:hypothetical protein
MRSKLFVQGQHWNIGGQKEFGGREQFFFKKKTITKFVYTREMTIFLCMVK